MADGTRSDHETTSRSPHKAGAFDIRVFIGALLGLYGVILTLTGILGTTAADLEQAGGVNVNLWTGLALLVTAALFLLWARRRPVVVPAEHEDQAEDG
jgi:xanthine/uracil/vitamin C permease (AzgA family)